MQMMLYFNYCITNNYHADKVLQHIFRFDILRNFKVIIFQHKDAQSPLSLCPPRGERTGRVALPRDLVPRELPERSGFHGFHCRPSSRSPAAPFVLFLSFCAKPSSTPSAPPRLRVGSSLPLFCRAPQKWSSWLSWDYGRHWHFRLFSDCLMVLRAGRRAPAGHLQ